jgi:hypothetical protein
LPGSEICFSTAVVPARPIREKALSAREVMEAEIRRRQIFHRLREFMRDREFPRLPVNQVPCFDIGQRYVTEVAGGRVGFGPCRAGAAVTPAPTGLRLRGRESSGVPIRCPN